MEEQGKGVRVSNCPFGWDVCYLSCYWRKGNRCYYASKQGGRIIKPKKEGGELQLMKLAIEKGYRARLAIAQMVFGVLICCSPCVKRLTTLLDWVLLKLVYILFWERIKKTIENIRFG